MSRNLTPMLLLTTMLPTLAACDGLVGPRYEGTPLLSLRGAARQALGASDPGNVDALLAWNNFSGSVDFTMMDRVALSGEFPEAFSLQLDDAPVEEALNDFGEGEPRLGVAYILAATAGSDLEDQADLKGVAQQQILLYLESDASPDSFVAEWTGVHTAGYHLMQTESPSQEEIDTWDVCYAERGAAEDQCIEDCGEEASEECEANCDPLVACGEQPVFDRFVAELPIDAQVDLTIGALHVPNVT